MSNYAQYTHGSLLGFITAWANWVSLVTIIPIEAVSAVQYMSSWPWDWAKPMGSLMKSWLISTYGLIAVYIIIAIFSLLNYWSVKLLTSFTSLISVFKLGVPILTIIMLLVSVLIQVIWTLYRYIYALRKCTYFCCNNNIWNYLLI